MSTITIKDNIKQLLNQIEDEKILMEIELIIAEYLQNNLEKPIKELNDYEKNTIQKGLDDLKNGNEIPHAEILKQIEAWRKK